MIDLDKPNIVVVTGPFQDVAGVAILSNFIDILEPLSSELYVITGKFSDRLNKRIHIIKIKSDEKRELAFIRAIKYIFKQVRTTYNLIKISKNVDTIIFFIGTRIDVLPSLTAKLLGKKTVSIATGSSSNIAESDNVSLFGIGRFFYPRIFRILERVNYSLSDQIIIDSNVESENLIRQFGLAKYRDKIFFGGVLPVDVNFFRINIKLEDRRNVIGYVGRLSQEKGVLNFVKAIPLILKERNDLEFIICGGGGLFEEIKAELKNNGSCDKVTLTGWIPHEKLPDHFNEMKLIVVPSYTETVPYVILEAMACGTPVVASPVAAIPDLIRNGENGFLMESNSPECIANNVIQDLDDPMLDEIVKIAHNLINTEYTYKVVVENYKKNLMKNR